MTRLHLRDLFWLTTVVSLIILLCIQCVQLAAMKREKARWRWMFTSLESTLDEMGYEVTVDDEGPWKYVGIDHKRTPP